MYPLPWLTALLSPAHLLLGGLLAGLVGLNLAVAISAEATGCRRTGHSRLLAALPTLLAALPTLLTGVACCVPTVLIMLDTSTAALLLPVLVPLDAVPPTVTVVAGRRPGLGSPTAARRRPGAC